MKKIVSILALLILVSCGSSDEKVCKEKGYIPQSHDGYLYVKCYKNGKLIMKDKIKQFSLHVPIKEEENGYDRCIIDG